MGFSYIPDNLESIGILRGAEIIRNRRIWISWTLKKRNEPEPMPEIEVQRTPFKNSIMRQQEYKQKEKWAKDQIRSRRIRYENRILKNASAVDLILDYYTLA